MKTPRQFTTPEIIFVSLVAWVVGTVVAACIIAAQGI
jgi:hypothetical protein